MLTGQERWELLELRREVLGMAIDAKLRRAVKVARELLLEALIDQTAAAALKVARSIKDRVLVQTIRERNRRLYQKHFGGGV